MPWKQIIKGALEAVDPNAYKSSAGRGSDIADRAREQKSHAPELDMEQYLEDRGQPPIEPPPQEQYLGADSESSEPYPLPGARGLNVENIRAPEDITNYMEEISGKIDAGERSWAAVQGTDHRVALESLVGRSPHSGFSDRQLFAIRVELNNQANELHQMATVAASNPDKVTPESSAQLLKKLNDYVAFQRYAQGASAEAARALNSMKIPVAADGATRVKAIDEIISSHGGIRRTQQIIKAISELDPNMGEEQFAKAARDIQGGKLWRPLVEIWINGLISGPSTWAVNASSNAAVMAYENIVIRPTAALIGKGRTALRPDTEDPIYAIESVAETYGAYQGWIDGMQLFGKEIANVDYNNFGKVSKSEIDNWHAFSSRNWNISPETPMGKGIDFIGDWYVRIPGRVLQGQDQWFKAMIYRQDLNSGAMRHALGELRAGEITEDQVGARIKYIMENPIDPEGKYNIHDAAIERAEYQTFTGELKPGESMISDAALAIQQFSYRHPSAKLIVPFIRTPARLLEYAVENGIPVLRHKWWNDLKAGGVRQDMALARLGQASMMWTFFASMHDEGRITGDAPSNPAIKELMRAQGIPPNSLKIGDRWYSYNRSDPFGMVLAAIANGMDAQAYSQDEHGALTSIVTSILGLAQDFTEKSFMIGMAETMRLLTEDERSLAKAGTNYLGGMTSSFIPSWANYVAKSIDVTEEGQAINRGAYRYTLRNANMWDAMAKRFHARTPFVREDLPMIRNWKGEDSLQDEGGFFAEFFPNKMMDPKNDPVSYQLYKSGVSIKRPLDKQRMANGEYISLLGLDHNEGHVYWKYAEIVGKERFKMAKTMAVPMDRFREMDETDYGPGSPRAIMFEDAIRAGTDLGRVKFFSWYKKEAPKHPDWVQVDSFEWDEMNKDLGTEGAPYAPPGSEPATESPAEIGFM